MAFFCAFEHLATTTPVSSIEFIEPQCYRIAHRYDFVLILARFFAGFINNEKRSCIHLVDGFVRRTRIRVVSMGSNFEGHRKLSDGFWACLIRFHVITPKEKKH